MKTLTVGELRAMLKDLPDNMPVHVNDVGGGEYHEEGVDAFHCEADGDEVIAALIITVGD